MYLIFLLSLRCYSQKKDNLRALMIFQKDLYLPVARCKSRGVTILLSVYDGLPFLTSRWVWNPIILSFRSSVENFESYCLYLCKFVKTSLNHIFDVEKRLEQLPQVPHDLSELTSFSRVSVTKLLVLLGLLTLYIVFMFLCIYASFYINAIIIWNWLFT